MATENCDVLVTGADGFIGSHLTEALVRLGYRVRAMVLYNSFNRRGWLDHVPEKTLEAVEVFPADIRDAHYMNAAVGGVRIVFHLASLIAVPYSYHSPDSYVETNIRGTLNLLQAARQAGIEKFVHTSTSEVYGSAQYVPIDENHPLVGQSPYAASKIAADQMALAFHLSFGLPVTIVRPFNTYGPRQSARAIIPTIITQVVSGRNPIKLGSLIPRRDFTYVDDTVAGLIAAAEHKERVVGETINIGTGKDISIGELVKLVGTVTGKSVSVEEEAQRVRPERSEVVRLQCENHKARELLDWEPQVELADGLEKTLAWFSDKNNLSLYQSDRYVL